MNAKREEGAAMAGETSDVVADLVKRIERLEREAEDLRGELQRSASDPRARRAVDAEEFVVRDSSGKRRATLGMDSDGSPKLRIFDESEKVRIALSVLFEGSPTILLYDRAIGVRVALCVSADGLPYLRLYDQADRPRAGLDVFPDDSAMLRILDRHGKAVWQAP
jgi:hypothetical protein